jgi:general secretion pathway protein N
VTLRAVPGVAWAMAAALAAFAFALIAFAPATLIDARLAALSGGRLRVTEAQGSLWSGAGWLEVREANGSAGIAKRLAWRLLPLSLLRGQLVAQIELDQTGRRFPVTVSLSRLDIADADFNLPAAALGLGVPKLAPFRLTGDVLVMIPHLSLEHGRMEGDATLRWRTAGSALTRVAPLGDYEVRFKASGPGVQAVLTTLEGPVRLDGNASWSNGSAPTFLATATVPPQHQDQLAPLFRLIAIERGAGLFELSSSQAPFGR